MNNQRFNDTIQNKHCQETWQEYFDRISVPGYQSPLISPDDSPLTLKELLLGFLNDLEERAPPDGLTDLVVKSLNALIDIAESHNARPDYTDELRELIELATKIERHLKDILKEPHQSSEEV